MLSEDEKARIKAEEIYRHEVQDELSRGKDSKSRVWTFLNSSIFLWFLSTVAVGSITYVWTTHQNRVADERAKSQKETEIVLARKAKINNLNLEIEGRLSQFLVDVEHMVKKPYDQSYTLKKPYTIKDVRKRWDLMKMSPRISQNTSTIYPEFVERGIVSLIIELGKLKQEAKREENRNKASSDNVKEDADEIDYNLRQVVVDIQDDIIFDDKEKNEFLPIYVEFNKRIMRWDTMFPSMDCGAESPFC